MRDRQQHATLDVSMIHSVLRLYKQMKNVEIQQKVKHTTHNIYYALNKQNNNYKCAMCNSPAAVQTATARGLT